MKNLVEQTENLISEIKEGLADPLEAAVTLKELDKLLKAAKEAVKEPVSKALNGRKVEAFGYKLEPMNPIPRYKYDHLSAWTQAKERLQYIERLAKEALKNGGEVVDEETGEIIGPAEIAYSSAFYKLTKNKSK